MNTNGFVLGEGNFSLPPARACGRDDACILSVCARLFAPYVCLSVCLSCNFEVDDVEI